LIITVLILIAVTVTSVSGGYVAVHEPRLSRRVTSFAAPIFSIGSAGAFIRLIHAHNVQRFQVYALNPVAGLEPWDLIALLLSLIAITASILGVKKARLLLLASSVLIFSYTLLMLGLWD
jgi:hypothetical protein